MSEFQRLVAETAPPCTKVDPEIFFPVSITPETVADPKAICAQCPIRYACLANAIATDDTYAILGGSTPEERRLMMQRVAA